MLTNRSISVIKFAIVLFAALLTAACATFSPVSKPVEPNAFARVYNLPCNKQTVVSPRMSNESAQEKYAINEAACRIAMSKKLFVFSGQVNQSFGKAERINNDFSYHYDDTTIPTIVETLTVKQQQQLEEGQCLYLVTSTTEPEKDRSATYNIAPSYFELTPTGKPRWVTTLPTLKTHLITYGITRPCRNLSDSLFAADLAAACALVRLHETTIRNFALNSESTAANKADVYRKGGVSLAADSIEGFFVIDRWINPENGDVYSLAVCNAQ